MKKRLFVCLLLAAGLVGPAWANPSSALSLKVVPERDAICRGSKELIIQVDLEGKKAANTARRTPINLALVLDRSGSMAGAKLEKARQAAAVVVDQLTADDSLALVIYDNEAEVLFPLQRVGTLRDRARLKEKIHAIEPGGGTALHAGVKLGSEQLRRELKEENVNRVILLSDGLANVGPKTPADLARLGRELRGGGVSVSTVGLGDDYNEDLMTALAESSHANYYYVQDAEKLPGVFAEELGSVQQVLARGVTIRIEVPEGVSIREIIGQPEIKHSGRVAELQIPEYFASDRRQLLVRCAIEDTTAVNMRVAHTRLAYQDSDTGREVEVTSDTEVRLVDDERTSAASVRNDVASNVASVRNRLDKEAAVALADKGDAKSAAELLKSRIAANVQLPESQQMRGVTEENRKLQQTVQELEARGALGKTSRKQVQYENWKGKYQKDSQ